MNKTKIEWTDYTWNPVTGCLRNCWYCYVKRLKEYDRTPTFHPSRLNQPLRVTRPARIFVCSTADLFGEWVPVGWIWKVLDVVKQCPQHTFQFLTKYPENYRDFKFPSNCWLGATITESDHYEAIQSLKLFDSTNLKFISFEPLLKPVISPIPKNISWVIIGAMTGPESEKHKPDPVWIYNLTLKAKEAGAAVFLKNNLKGIWPGELKQEFPK